MNLTFWFYSEADSGKGWTWDSLIVPKPLEAWYYVAKLLIALLIFLPPILVREKLSSTRQSSSLESKESWLWMVSILLILPVLGGITLSSILQPVTLA